MRLCKTSEIFIVRKKISFSDQTFKANKHLVVVGHSEYFDSLSMIFCLIDTLIPITTPKMVAPSTFGGEKIFLHQPN